MAVLCLCCISVKIYIMLMSIVSFNTFIFFVTDCSWQSGHMNPSSKISNQPSVNPAEVMKVLIKDTEDVDTSASGKHWFTFVFSNSKTCQAETLLVFNFSYRMYLADVTCICSYCAVWSAFSLQLCNTFALSEVQHSVGLYQRHVAKTVYHVWIQLLSSLCMMASYPDAHKLFIYL